MQLLIEDNLYVVIKNIGFSSEQAVFESFIKLFGNHYGAVDYTDIKMEYLYTACQFKRIELHNDNAIDLVDQSRLVFIQVVREDPLKSTKNGVVKVDDIIKYLRSVDKELLELLFTYKIPMLSLGINYNESNRDKILTKEPILYIDGENVNVRFDLPRLEYYYWKEKIDQPFKEKNLINKFLSIANKFRHEFYLEQGDILIMNNKRTLHDRTECNFLLNQNGSLKTREIFYCFVKEY